MKRPILWAGTVLLCILAGTSISAGKELVINNGFELNPDDLEVYWTVEGFDQTIYPLPFGVEYYDTNGDGQLSQAFRSDPFEHPLWGTSEGYLKQQIFVEAGKTYIFSADICYYNC